MLRNPTVKRVFNHPMVQNRVLPNLNALDTQVLGACIEGIMEGKSYLFFTEIQSKVKQVTYQWVSLEQIQESIEKLRHMELRIQSPKSGQVSSAELQILETHFGKPMVSDFEIFETSHVLPGITFVKVVEGKVVEGIYGFKPDVLLKVLDRTLIRDVPTLDDVSRETLEQALFSV